MRERFHYMLRRFYEDPNHSPLKGPEFDVTAGGDDAAMMEARTLCRTNAGPVVTHCKLYRVTKRGRADIWDSRDDPGTS